MRATGGRNSAREVDEVSSSLVRLEAAADKADKKFNKLSGKQMALFGLGPALVPALAAVTGGVMALGNAFGPAAVGAGLFGSIFKSQVTAVGTAATAIENAQHKVNATYGPQFVTQHTAAVKQLLLLNRQLTDQFGTGGPAIVNRYAAVDEQFQNFKASLNPQIFSLLGAGLGLVSKLLPKLHPLMVATANAFIKITTALSKDVGGSGFTRFLAWMTREAPKGILAFAHIIGNLATGFYNLFRAFGGGERMRKGLVGMTQAFADWSKHLGSNAGFQKFLAYVRDSGPKVLHALGGIVSAVASLGPLLAAAGGSSLIVLNALTDLVKLIAGIPVIGPLLGALIAPLIIASKLAGGIKATAAALAFLTLSTEGSATAFWALNASLDANPLVWIAGLVIGLGFAFYEAYKHSKTFRGIVDGIWSGIKTGAKDAIEFVIGVINTLFKAYNAASGFVHDITGGLLGGGHYNLITDPFASKPTPLAPGRHAAGHLAAGLGLSGHVGLPAPVKGHRAGGGRISESGFYEVGERGPEKVWLNRGQSVDPHGAGGVTHFHSHIYLDGKEIATSTVRYGNYAKSVR